MTVHVERTGPVGVITLDRPRRRNAVDRPTADALAAAVSSLDGDAELAAIVLTGAVGTFCSGADLHAFDDPDRRNRLSATLDGPMGPTRSAPRLPV
ncbi:MAG: enoyl-CoA hydratase-related protein, partial [Actinomycetota bacterium]